ncbi:protein of unknown function [Methylococcus capsulatus]|jgi:hypothetical protein|uniref:Uncharacterized protein n=1 Tax=Methylococcus capsulatus TaxID=414 RepID=A0AA35Y0F1_METCP|nr:protein of unknown function [Methylococcus capsulatus]
MTALALIERGHAGVWHYPWRLFLQARLMRRR